MCGVCCPAVSCAGGAWMCVLELTCIAEYVWCLLSCGLLYRWCADYQFGSTRTFSRVDPKRRKHAPEKQTYTNHRYVTKLTSFLFTVLCTGGAPTFGCAPRGRVWIWRRRGTAARSAKLARGRPLPRGCLALSGATPCCARSPRRHRRAGFAEEVEELAQTDGAGIPYIDYVYIYVYVYVYMYI